MRTSYLKTQWHQHWWKYWNQLDQHTLCEDPICSALHKLPSFMGYKSQSCFAQMTNSHFSEQIPPYAITHR